MKFLFLLFFIFLFMVFALGFSVIRFIFRLFLGGRNYRHPSSSRERQEQENYSSTRNNPTKIFSKNEGEYIDYEEVK